jgi:hypothetical protein
MEARMTDQYDITLLRRLQFALDNAAHDLDDKYHADLQKIDEIIERLYLSIHKELESGCELIRRHE